MVTAHELMSFMMPPMTSRASRGWSVATSVRTTATRRSNCSLSRTMPDRVAVPSSSSPAAGVQTLLGRFGPGWTLLATRRNRQ